MPYSIFIVSLNTIITCISLLRQCCQVCVKVIGKAICLTAMVRSWESPKDALQQLDSSLMACHGLPRLSQNTITCTLENPQITAAWSNAIWSNRKFPRLVHPCAWTLLARCLIRIVFWNVKSRTEESTDYWSVKAIGTLINGGYISCRSNDFHLATPFTMTTKCIKHENFINLLRSFAWAFAKRSAVLCNSLGTEQCPKTGSLSTCHCYRKGRIKKQI